MLIRHFNDRAWILVCGTISRRRVHIKPCILQTSDQKCSQGLSVENQLMQSLKEEYGRERLKASLDGLDQQGLAAFLQRCVSLTEGKCVHAFIIANGLERDQFLANLLITMYGKYGALEDARLVFDNMQHRNVISWTSMIATYVQHGYGNEALQLFQQMQEENVKPDKVAFICALGACATVAALLQGQAIHRSIVDYGLESDIIVGTALINMYCKCGALQYAWQVFEKMHQRDIVSWNAMITGYSQNGDGNRALQTFQQMRQEMVKPNKVTFISILAACASQAALLEGERIHADIIDSGLESHLIVGNALINMYGKCGALEKASSVFAKMDQRNVVSWNTMITAYARHGHCEEAFCFLRQMQQEGVKPNEITFTTILSACASMAAIRETETVHSYIVDSGFESDVFVGNALVNAYGKCGDLQKALSVFSKMHRHDVVSWNAIIAAYTQYGHAEEALQFFDQMQQECAKPDGVTFVSLLSACSHAGLVDEGFQCFLSMSQDYTIRHTVEHYGCVVDLFGRAGKLREAEDFIHQMPFKPDALVWITLLCACRAHGDVKRGMHAAERILDLSPYNVAPYVLLSNIYAADGRWSKVDKVREAMIERGVKMQPVSSFIQVKDKMHQFFVTDRLHAETEVIYVELERLNRLIEAAGYVPDTKLLLHDVEEELNEQLDCYHSEKLAIAFGLINTLPGMPLRIVKNLRICSDCHSALKFVCKVVGREIVVRDANNFHRFKHGLCSCKDYW